MSISEGADENVGTIVRERGWGKGGRRNAGEKINAGRAEASQRKGRRGRQGGGVVGVRGSE